MRAKKGVPAVVPVTPNVTLVLPDAISLPPKYKGTVLLVAEDLAGVQVFRSRDGLWKTADYLGLIRWMDSSTVVPAAKQIRDAIYIDALPFGDSAVAGTAGNQSHFLFADITAQVDALLLK